MRSAILLSLLLLSLPNSQTAQERPRGHIILPSPQLLRCKATDCFQLWSGKPEERNAIFPKQFVVDMNGDCLYGMTATYDKSVSVEAIKEAIDTEYGKWALSDFAKSPIKLWRVQPEKFAIQLSEPGTKDQKMNKAEEGTKQVTYIAFGGRSACANTAN